MQLRKMQKRENNNESAFPIQLLLRKLNKTSYQDFYPNIFLANKPR